MLGKFIGLFEVYVVYELVVDSNGIINVVFLDFFNVYYRILE